MGTPFHRFRTVLVGTLFFLFGASKAFSQTEADAFGDPSRIGTVRFRHSDSICSLSYSADGKRLVSAAANAVAVWDASTGQRLSLHKFPRRQTVPAISPGGALAAYSMDETSLVIREMESGKIRVIRAPSATIHGLNFSQDASKLAAADNSSNVFVWDTTNGKLLKTWRPIDATGDRCHHAFTSNGKTLIHAAERGVIVGLDIETGEERFRVDPQKEKHGQYGLTVSPDGLTLATINANGGRIELRRLKTGEFLRQIRPAASASGLAFSPDSKHLLWLDGKEVCFWDLARETISRRLPAGIGYSGRLAFSPDARFLAGGGGEQFVQQWDLTNDKNRHSPALSQAQVAWVGFLSDGKTLFSKSRNLRVIQDLNGKVVREADKEPIDPSHTDISPDGAIIAIWDQKQRSIRLRDAVSGKTLVDLEKLAGFVFALNFSADGQFLFARSVDESVNLIGTSRPHFLHVWKRTAKTEFTKAHKLTFTFFVYHSPESQWIAVRDRGSLDFHDCETGRLIRKLPPLQFTISAASPSGRVLVMPPRNPSAPRLIEMATGKPVGTLACPRTRMDFSRFAFSPDGKTVAAGLESGAILLWDALSGKQIGKLEGHHGNVISLEFSRDGRFLLSASRDTTTLIWDCSKIIPAAPTRSDLTKEILDSLWRDLQAEDAERAFQAMSVLVSAPTQSVAYFRKRLHPACEEDHRHVKRLIEDLENTDFKARNHATAELTKIGEPASSFLRQVLSKPVSLECKRRVTGILEQFPGMVPPPEWLRTVRALDTLELIGSREARKLLDELASGIPEARQTQEARFNLERLKRRGK